MYTHTSYAIRTHHPRPEIEKYALITFYAPRKISEEHIVAALSVRPGKQMDTCWVLNYPTNAHLWEFSIPLVFYWVVFRLFCSFKQKKYPTNVHLWGRQSVRTSHSCPAHNCYLKWDFETILQKWPPCWDDVSRATFGSLPWRSRSQRDLVAKSCPAHNFVTWSRISNLFHRKDHHIVTTCRVQHLGRYLEGQGHNMTLQQNCVRPITLLLEVGFQIFFTEMITILRRRVACNIWVATLKVKVRTWPCSKIVSG